MPFEADVLRKVPLFATLDDEELGILSTQVELRRFAAQQRIYKTGTPARRPTCWLRGACG